MADTAAHLVDRVLPEAPVRQWVLSLPHSLRYRLAYDGDLSSAVLGIFIRSVFVSLRRRARARFGEQARDARCGAVTFVQRFGDALNLNVHFHSLVLDGVYLQAPEGSLRFRSLPPPTDGEVERVATTIARRLVRLLERRDLLAASPTEADPLASDDSVLGELYAASVHHRSAAGPRAGRLVVRLGDRIDADDVDRSGGERCAAVGGVSLHANVDVPGQDRKRLERLCRYVTRPPVAAGRLTRLADGRLCYRLERRWRDGTSHVVFELLELLERLVALIPPPRANQVRYHGVLAPAAPWRTAVSRDRRSLRALGSHSQPAARSAAAGVLEGASEPASPLAPASVRPSQPALGCASPGDADLVRVGGSPGSAPLRARRLSWAALMQRVFARDVLECPSCGGRMRLIAAIEQPEVVGAILRCLGLATRAPPTAPARDTELPLFAASELPQASHDRDRQLPD
jgi:hypothetical protein